MSDVATARARRLWDEAYGSPGEMPCDSEPHGEDASAVAANDAKLRRIGQQVVTVAREERVLGRMAAYEPGLGRYWPPARNKIDAEADSAAVREFCDAFGIQVPVDIPRALRAIQGLRRL